MQDSLLASYNQNSCLDAFMPIPCLRLIKSFPILLFLNKNSYL